MSLMNTVNMADPTVNGPYQMPNVALVSEALTTLAEEGRKIGNIPAVNEGARLAERVEQVFRRQEERAQRQEEKLDRLLGLVQRQEERLDHLVELYQRMQQQINTQQEQMHRQHHDLLAQIERIDVRFDDMEKRLIAT